ncbi:MAG: hypothetical protein FJX72_18955, partial [Armatimonadetes bacterium]|nr:hypothetical protein [Armatimonadota bacterium]
MADVDDAMTGLSGRAGATNAPQAPPLPEQRVHTLHFGFASAESGWSRFVAEDTGSWSSEAMTAIESIARQGAVDGNPEELFRFVGSLAGRVVAIRYTELGGKAVGSGRALRRGSFDTRVAATQAPRRCLSAGALVDDQHSELQRARLISCLAGLDAGLRREFLAQVTIAVFGEAGTVWLPGLSVREQFDACLSVFPWAFMETVELVSHPGLDPAAPGVLGRLVVYPGKIAHGVERPEWLDSFVGHIDAAIGGAPEDFARRLQWLDDSPKFRDPKGYIQVVTAWFRAPKDAMECQERVAVVLRQRRVPVEIRRSACELLVDRIANTVDPTLLDAIAAAGSGWREQDTGSNLPDDLLGLLAQRLRQNGFSDGKSVLANQSLEVIEVLASASSHGLHGDGGGNLLHLLSDAVEASSSVAGGALEEWIANLQLASRQRVELPATCRRLVARIWREYALAYRSEDKKRLTQLLALRKGLARLDVDLRIGEVDLEVVRRETDAAMLEAFVICRRAMGRGWLAKALRLHAEAARCAGQPLEPTIRKTLGNGERVGAAYTRDFFRAL